MISQASIASIESALATATRLKNLLGGRWNIRLDADQRSRTILTVAAEQERDVLSLSESEAEEVRAIVRDHVEMVRGPGGRVSASADDAREMYRALGEWYRSLIADKIDDRVAVHKRPLTEQYARQKQAEFGRTHPILVASGELLDDIRTARLRVEKVG